MNEVQRHQQTTSLTPHAKVGKRYTLEKLLGQGGMAEVWLGRELDGGPRERLVAIKTPRKQDEGTLSRFYREARAHFLLRDQPCIVHMHGFEHPEGQAPYLVLELMMGGNLKELLKAFAQDRLESDRLPSGLTRDLALQLAWYASQAIKSMHDINLVHRDLKPSNFLLSSPLESIRQHGQAILKLGDLGIVGEMDLEGGSETQLGAMVGSWDYAPPEYLNDLASQKDTARDLPTLKSGDVYGLGLVFYEIWTGEPLIRDAVSGSAGTTTSSRALRAQERLKKALQSLNGAGHSLTIDPDMQALIQKMLDPKPANRPELSKVLAQLEEHFRTRPERSTASGNGGMQEARVSARSLLRWSMGPAGIGRKLAYAAALLLALGGGWWMGGGQKPTAIASVNPGGSSPESTMSQNVEPSPGHESGSASAPEQRVVSGPAGDSRAEAPSPKKTETAQPVAKTPPAQSATARALLPASTNLLTLETLPQADSADKDFVLQLKRGELKPVASGTKDLQASDKELVIKSKPGAGISAPEEGTKVAHSTNTLLPGGGATIGVALRHGNSHYYSIIKGFREEPNWQHDYDTGQALGKVAQGGRVTQALVYSLNPIDSWKDLNQRDVKYVSPQVIGER